MNSFLQGDWGGGVASVTKVRKKALGCGLIECILSVAIFHMAAESVSRVVRDRPAFFFFFFFFRFFVRSVEVVAPLASRATVGETEARRYCQRRPQSLKHVCACFAHADGLNWQLLYCCKVMATLSITVVSGYHATHSTGQRKTMKISILFVQRRACD